MRYPYIPRAADKTPKPVVLEADGYHASLEGVTLTVVSTEGASLALGAPDDPASRSLTVQPLLDPRTARRSTRHSLGSPITTAAHRDATRTVVINTGLFSGPGWVMTVSHVYLVEGDKVDLSVFTETGHKTRPHAGGSTEWPSADGIATVTWDGDVPATFSTANLGALSVTGRNASAVPTLLHDDQAVVVLCYGTGAPVPKTPREALDLIDEARLDWGLSAGIGRWLVTLASAPVAAVWRALGDPSDEPDGFLTVCFLALTIASGVFAVVAHGTLSGAIFAALTVGSMTWLSGSAVALRQHAAGVSQLAIARARLVASVVLALTGAVVALAAGPQILGPDPLAAGAYAVALLVAVIVGGAAVGIARRAVAQIRALMRAI